MRQFLVFFVFTLIISATSILMAEAESESKDTVSSGGFLGNWHHSEMCDDCHATLLSKDQLTRITGYCKCHRDEFMTGGKADMEKLSKAHGISTCVRCHVGTVGDVGAEITYANIHIAHVDADCEKCHGDKENIFTPEVKECNLCHQGGIHLVHGDKTGEMCAICHGSAGKVFEEEDYSDYPVEELVIPDSITPDESTSSPRYPTILVMLREFIAFIFGQ
ncbi:MAG: hypothetical protein SVM80_08035 [Halobacteriota archaeon]|nr:hypothetical protein [Halobacteriota archaeon]